MDKNPHCPECQKAINQSEIDLDGWMACCTGCGSEVPLNELDYRAQDMERSELNQLPKGVTLKPGFDHLEIQFSLFSLKQTLVALGICLFWNGIVSVFLSLAVAAVCYNAMGYVPDWIPVPGLEDGKPVMNDQVMGWGMTIFFCLFLTPFVAIGFYLLFYLIMRIGGWTKILLDPRLCRISTGISFLSRQRNFQPGDIRSIKRVVRYDKGRTDADNYRIEMKTGGKPVKFGGMLSEEQQLWIIHLLRKALLGNKPVDFAQLASRFHR
ncbi:MAG: hypothetical protein R3242_11335 [Akkermansiaceae bacterium]|nr:hypothetical protein [Akkermansiaceae bacterium]